MLTSSRLSFLGGMAIAAVPTGVATAYALAPISLDKRISPGERLEAAVLELEAAMIAIHGEGVRVIRETNKSLRFLEPFRPRIVEYAGAGRYEVEVSPGNHIIYAIDRDPKRRDDPVEGRCFRCVPETGRPRQTVFMFEDYLRTVLIRRI